MATEVIYQVGSGHKRPGYDTILGFLVGTQVDCVASGVIIIGELMVDETFDEDGIVFVGATTDEDNYRVLRAHPSVRHTGKIGTGPSLYSDPGGFAAVVAFQENYARLEDVVIRSDGNGIMYGVFGADTASGYSCTNVIVDSCVYGGFVYEGSGSMTNCVACHVGVISGYFGGFAGINGKESEVRARYCVAFKNDDADTIQVTAYRYVSAQNCAAFNYGGAGGHQCYLNLATDSINYAASDNTGYGALNSLDPDDIFISIASGSADFHLSSGTTALSGAGSGIAGITTDIDGQSRDATAPDIGVDEWHAPQSIETISYLSALQGKMQASGDYNFSTATVQLPTGAGVPDIQTRTFGESSELLTGQMLYMSASGTLLIADVDTIWLGIEF